MPKSIALHGVLVIVLAGVAVALPAYYAHCFLTSTQLERSASSTEAFLAVALASYLNAVADTSDDYADWAGQMSQVSERLRWAGVFRSDGEGLEFRRQVSLKRELIVEQIDFDATEPLLKPLVVSGHTSERFFLHTVPQPDNDMTLAAIVDLGDPKPGATTVPLFGLVAAVLAGLSVCFGWYYFTILRPVGEIGRSLATMRAEMTASVLSHLPPQELDDVLSSAEQTRQELKRWRVEADVMRQTLDLQVDAKTREIAKKLTHAKRKADVDSLTRLGNRRMLQRELPPLFERQCDTGGELAAIMIDVNHFKQLNDTLGHRAGDELLGFLGELVRATVRKQTDLAVRYGGDEIVLVLPDTTADQAVAIAERIASLFAQRRKTFGPLPQPPTISAGIAARDEHHADTWEQLLQSADDAMYWAKRNGLPAARFDQVDMPVAD